MGNVIQNRATATGQTPAQVVSGKNPIEGYGSDRYNKGLATINSLEQSGTLPKLGKGEATAVQNAIAGALYGLGGGPDITLGAYFWGHDASYFENSPAFDQTTELGNAQFYKYNADWQKEHKHMRSFP